MTEERENDPQRSPSPTEIGLVLPLGDPGLAGTRIHLTIEIPPTSTGSAPSASGSAVGPSGGTRANYIPQQEYPAPVPLPAPVSPGDQSTPVRDIVVPTPDTSGYTGAEATAGSRHAAAEDAASPGEPRDPSEGGSEAAPGDAPADVATRAERRATTAPALAQPQTPAPVVEDGITEPIAASAVAAVPGTSVPVVEDGITEPIAASAVAAVPGASVPVVESGIAEPIAASTVAARWEPEETELLPRSEAGGTPAAPEPSRTVQPGTPGAPATGLPATGLRAEGEEAATAPEPAAGTLTLVAPAPRSEQKASGASTRTRGSAAHPAPAVVGAPVNALTASPWYFPALAGIRGFIVLGVMLFHSGLVGQGIFVAVDVFFIVSGFVIVLQLMRRLDTTGKISARTFLGRRVKRIVPAQLVTLGLTMLITWRFGSLQEVQSAGTLSIWSLAQSANWYEILSGDAYWSMTGVVQPLAHMWSLSLLEQFYLVWPVFMIGLWWVSRKRLSIMTAIIGVLCVAAGFIAPMLWDGSNADRLYLGTDTRLVAVLAGALGGAVVYLILRPRIDRPLPGGRLWPSVVGCIGLAGLFIGALFGSDYHEPWLYEGGFAVAAVFGAALTASLAFRGNILSKIVGWSPFQMLGQVSYEMYLLHLPIFWMIQKLTPGISPFALFVSGAVATWVLGSILYFAFTQPWRLARWTWRRGIPIFLVAVLTVVALAYGLPKLRESQMGDATQTDAAALPVLPGAAGGRPVVMTVGDSVSRDFATALSDYGSNAFAVVDAGIGGCGLMSPDRVRAGSGYVFEQQNHCGSWPDSVAAALSENTPDIVLVHSVWDAADQHVDGKWMNACDPEYRTRYLAELGTLLDLVETRAPGAQVVFSNDRTTNKEMDDPRVMTCYGKILAEVAASRPSVHLLDLGGHLCPEEHCLAATPQGVPIFLRDDLHFTQGGLTWLAPWLEQEIAAVQRDARDAKVTKAAGEAGSVG